MTLSWASQSFADVPLRSEWLSAREREIHDALRVEKRRRDWCLGRWTAKRLLAQQLGLGFQELPRIEVLAAEDGAPEPFLDARPLSTSLSITHRDGLAVVATVEQGVVGCDLELVEPRTPAFVEDYFTEDERAVITSAGLEGRDQVVALLWSAKESALKCTRTGLRRDTRSVEVSFEIAGRATWAALRARDLEAERELAGWWRRVDRWVLSVAALPAQSEPERVELRSLGRRDDAR